MHRILLSVLILSLLVATASVGCSNDPGVTVLSVAEGSVCVIRGGTGDCTEVQPNTELRPGDIIKTDDASGAQIVLFDGSIVELEAGTEIEVESLEETGTGSIIIVLKQTIGSITFRVTKIIDPGSSYEVETPTGVASVRGSEMGVDVSEDGTTWITNLEGEIWASAQGVDLQIPIGQRCIIRPGQPPRLDEEVGQYALKIGNTGGGSVATPGRGTFTYDEGTVVSLHALPTKGHRFVNWTGNVDTVADVNAATTTITMNDHYSITANFEEAVQYDLKIGSTGGGSVANPGEGIFTYDEGKVVNLHALPTKGHRFVNWTGNVDTVADVNAATTTITMNDHYSITANFEEVVQYELKIGSTSGGSVATPGEGIFTYDEGKVVNLHALPTKGHRFVNWTGNVDTVADVNAATTTITMNDHYSITANFEEVIQYELKIGSTGGGSVATPGEGIFTYAEGKVVNLHALPTKGHRFVNWTGNVDTVADVNAATTTITMNDHYSITANFEEVIQYNLKIGSTGGGSVATPGEGIFTYDEGKVVNLHALPTKGHRFVNWTGNVGTIANPNAASTTITMNGNYSITANFEEVVQYELKIGSTSGGSVATPGEGIFTYEAGTVVSLHALPVKGYRFVNWTGNVGTIANPNAASTTITMNGNYSITANFEEDPQ